LVHPDNVGEPRPALILIDGMSFILEGSD